MRFCSICITVIGISPETLMKDVFKKYNLDDNIASFTGHAIACYRNDEWVLCVYMCMAIGRAGVVF